MKVLKVLKKIEEKGMYLDMLENNLLESKNGIGGKDESLEKGEIVGNLFTELIGSYNCSLIAATIKEAKFAMQTNANFKMIDTPENYQCTVMEILTKIELAFLSAAIITETDRDKINGFILGHYNVAL